MRKFGYAVAGVLGLGIIWIGAQYVVDPGAIAGSFGVPDAPSASDPFLRIKGVRDIGSGVVALGLLATRQDRALGWAMLATSVIPAGDAIIVLSNGGSPATALGVHGLTAAALVAGGAGLLYSATRTGGKATIGGALV
ncbi:MAG: DUF4267 domain-containing protein [Pseudonocardia sp.]|nr:DUF4267 domain-containing protein [Pseudonocardia sp.]